MGSYDREKIVYLACGPVFLLRQKAPNFSEHLQVLTAAQLYLLILRSDFALSLVNLWPIAVRSFALDPSYRPDTAPARHC